MKIYKKQLEEHRAKVNAVKRKETSKKLKTTKQSGQPSPVKKVENAQQKSSRVSSKEYQIAPQKYSVNNLDPVDMGAHLMLLGDSLTLVATALRRQVSVRIFVLCILSCFFELMKNLPLYICLFRFRPNFKGLFVNVRKSCFFSILHGLYFL